MGAMTGLEYYNDKMLTLAEHYDDFITARTLKRPSVWHDRIPRGAYKLFNGLEQKTNIYRGGLGVQAGLDTWDQIGLSRQPSAGDAGFDNCAMDTPQTYGYAWETVTFNGYRDSWQSEPICLNDMKYVDYAKEQLGLIIRTGVDYGISMLENFNREMYIQQAALANRLMLMATGSLAFEEDASMRFLYDPFATMEDIDGDDVPYISFPADAELSTLNWDFLDYVRSSLTERAAEAALGSDSNMPIFGLMLDLIDFERYIKSDPELRADWREARPMSLIDGYGMNMKVYRGFALINDPRQPRFRVHSVDANGRLIATRVKPQKLGRALTIGNEPIPNPEYFRAEIGLGVIFMNEVLQNLFVPSIDNLGSGTTFGPAPGLTGEWKWINVKDNNSNPLGETGYFYGRFQLFPKPLLFSNACTVFAYRRCAHALSKPCVIESDDAVGSGAITVTSDAVAADLDVTNNRVTLSLASLLGCGIGDAVTIVKDNLSGAAGDSFSARLVSDSMAPNYVFAWIDGASNEPTVIAEFTAAATTVTVA